MFNLLLNLMPSWLIVDSNNKPIEFEIIAIHISWECNDDAVNFQEIHLLWRYIINTIGTYNAGRNVTLFSFENNKALYSTAQWVQRNAQMQ